MHWQEPRSRRARDRGAAAVEFAIVLPLLLLLVFGIIDFGRLLNAQITLTQAAREGARLAALGQPEVTVVSRAQSAATGLSPVAVTVTGCPVGADPTADAVVSVSYSMSFATPVGDLGSPIRLTARGVMSCET